ncbi:neuroglian-like [Eupeodes corollae]|uniref:neuroglian-like n=1 Tax=Eupeodes corollae TaxID=290404 RepID=UPI00249028C5|nr:neuroglian-like [Eupeodes corollae]
MKTMQCTIAVVFINLIAITNALTILSPDNNDPPKITEGPLHTIVSEGSTVTFKCRASNSLKIIWEVNGMMIMNIGRKYEILPSGDLKIEKAFFMDSGEYTCRAFNQYGSVKESAKLDVKQKTRIFKENHMQKVTVGETAEFRCSVMFDESLSLEIEWLKDGAPIDYEKQDRYSKGNDNSLRILKTIGADSGEYICVARTDVDEDRKIVTLVVQDVPNPPMIVEVICNGLNADITWKPQGDNRSPILSYSLDYNTSFTPQNWVEGEGRIHSSQLKYTYIMNPGNTYSFRVVAHSRVGLSPPSEPSMSCTTQPDVPQNNPRNVKTESVDPTKLVITWTPMPEIEHSGPNLHYRVFWKREVPDSEWESKEILDWQESKAVIEDQPTFVKYLVKVLAINDRGESRTPASEVIGYSGEDRPLLAPKNFKMLELEGSTAAYLKWDPVSSESLRGHFEGYKLKTWTSNEGEESFREVKVQNDKNEVLFTMLKPYSKNFVQLCAYNSRFDGPSTLISFDTPEGLPSHVENLQVYVLSATDMLIKWDKPLEPNGRLTGYRVYYEEIRGSYVGDRQEMHGRINDPEVTIARLGLLRPDTKYRISVSATTNMGEGREYFIEKKTLRLDRRPQEPSEPHFKWEPLTSIKVTWQPFNGYPTGTHFYTQYRVKGETEWHDKPEEENDLSQIIGGLSRNTTYEFRVVSVDGKYKKESGIQEIKTL